LYQTCQNNDCYQGYHCGTNKVLPKLSSRWVCVRCGTIDSPVYFLVVYGSLSYRHFLKFVLYLNCGDVVVTVTKLKELFLIANDYVLIILCKRERKEPDRSHSKSHRPLLHLVLLIYSSNSDLLFPHVAGSSCPSFTLTFSRQPEKNCFL